MPGTAGATTTRRRPIPYDDLLAENGRRGKLDPEYELLDTGVFDEDRYWIVEVDYVKADPTDVIMVIRATNAGPDADTLHVLPTVWFRNTWSWDVDAPKPRLHADVRRRGVDRPPVPRRARAVEWRRASTAPQPTAAVLRERDERHAAVRDIAGDTVPEGRDQRPRRRRRGHRQPATGGHQGRVLVPAHVPGGETAEVRLRLRPAGSKPKPAEALGADLDEVVARRRAEADEFYAEMSPPGTSAEHAMVMRQAFAGMLWSKQLYAYDVQRWLDGDPTQPPPPASRRSGRNARWSNFDAFDIMSMPDKWEYPWFAAWDLGFHCVALAHVDPAFAKYQLVLLCREWFQHPNGALPAYEWDFGDVNPPVQAWAALEVFAIDGANDLDFLSRVFDKLLVNFTWWVNLEDSSGISLFEGGFLGLDNIGPLDRSHLPVGGTLEQSDATGWMAFYALAMAAIASILHRSGHRPAVGPGTEVPRALRRHPPGDGHVRRVGRRRRALLRPAGHPGRRPPSRSRSVRWSASSRCSPRSCSTSTI